ncbi:MAG: hypothetical protein LBE20_00785 [Deltaproteobacteria bacterium]|jgi:hypothetical protein|nr:hypothetical protein [Deltaproteobacteria bacterium]
MYFDYLEELELRIESGDVIYACQGQGTHQWHIGESLEDVSNKAQLVANLKKYPMPVYQLISGSEATPESYLVVKKVVLSSVGDPQRYDWVQVDTRQAAELVRDVAHGATPFFGLITESTIKPNK